MFRIVKSRGVFFHTNFHTKRFNLVKMLRYITICFVNGEIFDKFGSYLSIFKKKFDKEYVNS